MKVIYVGERFYWESETVMSSFYLEHKGHFERTDLGKIEIALQAGKSVEIRPATKAELALFEKSLAEIKAERMARR